MQRLLLKLLTSFFWISLLVGFPATFAQKIHLQIAKQPKQIIAIFLNGNPLPYLNNNEIIPFEVNSYDCLAIYVEGFLEKGKFIQIGSNLPHYIFLNVAVSSENQIDFKLLKN